MGSSPHPRGAHWRSSFAVLVSRIIPASAGSTSGLEEPCRNNQDHPRIRGEHPDLGALDVFEAGSSPHPRGAPKSLDKESPEIRIIPASAGSTSASTSSPTPRGDHPRIRGEHEDSTFPNTSTRGSSPHPRGARPWMIRSSGGMRIIPASAGSTISAAARPTGARDHPRIRGEHPLSPLAAAWPGGSSPHPRGAQWQSSPP